MKRWLRLNMANIKATLYLFPSILFIYRIVTQMEIVLLYFGNFGDSFHKSFYKKIAIFLWCAKYLFIGPTSTTYSFISAFFFLFSINRIAFYIFLLGPCLSCNLQVLYTFFKVYFSSKPTYFITRINNFCLDTVFSFFKVSF